MARPKTPDGLRMIIPARFSESEFARIDAEAGDMGRSAWIRAAALAALPGGGSERPGRRYETRQDAARAALSSALSVEPGPVDGAEDECPHPAEKIRDGRCECGFDDFAA